MRTVEGIEDAQPRAGHTPGSPLFLIGAPRSGTSLVYRALSLNPKAAYISNWLRRRPDWQAVSLLNRLPPLIRQLQVKYWFGEDSNAYRYGQRRSVVERLFPAPVEGEPVYEACGIGEAVVGLPTLDQAACLRAAFGAIARFGGGTTVISKRISNNRRIAFLDAVFPQARFVSIVRDGRAVAYSLSRVDWWEGGNVWWFGGTPEQWRERGGDPWDLCARTWVEEVRAIESGLATVDPARVKRVSYEELVADPLAQLSAIARFGGLPDSERWTASLRRLQFPNRNEGWRSNLDPELTNRIEGTQAEELHRYGYL